MSEQTNWTETWSHIAILVHTNTQHRQADRQTPLDSTDYTMHSMAGLKETVLHNIPKY